MPTKLDDIEQTWKENLQWAAEMTVDDGSAAMAADILSLVAVARAAEDVALSSGRVGVSRLKHTLAPLLSARR